LSGREGFGFGAFVEMKRLFFTAPEAKKWRQKEVTGMTGAGSDAAGVSGQFIPRAVAGRAPVRPVGHGTGASSQALEKLRSTRGQSDAVARQVMIDRTRPVMSGCLLESTGRWHYGIWSVQAARLVRPLSSASIWRPDARARPISSDRRVQSLVYAYDFIP
jgi:hypothetical protein